MRALFVDSSETWYSIEELGFMVEQAYAWFQARESFEIASKKDDEAWDARDKADETLFEVMFAFVYRDVGQHVDNMDTVKEIAVGTG